MNTFELNWKCNDFEIRTTKSFASGAPYVELVRWINDESNKPYCYTLAYYKWDEEGGDWVFVGTRPFDDITGAQIAEIWDQMGTITRMFVDWYTKNHEDVAF